MAALSQRQIIFGLLVLIFIVLSIFLFYYHIRFEDIVRLMGVSARDNSHGLLALIGFYLLGMGVMVFRFFNGARTRIVKYVHLVVQCAAIICIIVSFVVGINQQEAYGIYAYVPPENQTSDQVFLKHMDGGVHTVLGYITLISILLQFVVGVTILAYMYPDSKLRRNLAPFHDIFGIWIYIAVFCTYLTGIFYLHDNQIGCCSSGWEEAMDMMQNIVIVSYLSSLIILSAVLIPYFDWELVGPL